MLGHRGELEMPTKSKADTQAVEIARVWAVGGAMEVSLRVATQKDPAAWGIMLVDLAKHIANTYQQVDGRDPSEVLSRIRDGLDCRMVVADRYANWLGGAPRRSASEIARRCIGPRPRNRLLWSECGTAAASERQHVMRPKDDHFRWGNELAACFDDLREAFAARSPAIVDREILPHFDGRPYDMFIWFICERADRVADAKSQQRELQAAVQERMTALGVPKSAVDSLRSDVTSLQDIEAGGGRFYYFR